MIDFHSHIMNNVDDGADSIETSLEILKIANKVGFNSIILTPHYMENYYEYDVEQISEKIDKIKQICKKENLNIELYQANEIYISNNIVNLIKNKKASTINQSRYVLFELPMNEEPPNLLEVIYSLKEDNKIPIIAHPERYLYVQKEPNKLIELIEMGVLFQSNYGSIIGQYGKQCQKTVKLLLKNNFIHFLGTDVHKSVNIYSKIEKIKEELEKVMNKEQMEKIMEKNAEKVLKNELIDITEPKLIQKKIFQIFFS